MAEKIRPSIEWYQRRILEMPDVEPGVGPMSEFQENVEQGAHLQVLLAFGALVRLERRNRNLTVSEFAKLLDVEELEIRSIEHDPQYRAKPRTITLIAKTFKLPVKNVMKLAGAASANDDYFFEKATLFAAHSDDMGVLDEQERKLLNSFVEFLRDRG